MTNAGDTYINFALANLFILSKSSVIVNPDVHFGCHSRSRKDKRFVPRRTEILEQHKKQHIETTYHSGESVLPVCFVLNSLSPRRIVA